MNIGTKKLNGLSKLAFTPGGASIAAPSIIIFWSLREIFDVDVDVGILLCPRKLGGIWIVSLKLDPWHIRILSVEEMNLEASVLGYS